MAPAPATDTAGKTGQAFQNPRTPKTSSGLTPQTSALLPAAGEGPGVPNARVPSARGESGPGGGCGLVPDHCGTRAPCAGDDSGRSAPAGTGCAVQAPVPTLSGAGASSVRTLRPAQPRASARARGDPCWQHELAGQSGQTVLVVYAPSRSPKDERASRKCTRKRAGKQPRLSAAASSPPPPRSL